MGGSEFLNHWTLGIWGICKETQHIPTSYVDMFKWVKTYYHYILGGIHIHYPAIFRVPRLIIFNLRPSMSGTGGKTTRSLLYPLISSENSVSPYLLLKSVKSHGNSVLNQFNSHKIIIFHG